MTARRQDWCVTGWREFVTRCRSVRDDLDDLIRTFPETQGISAKLVGRFIKAHQTLVAAMIRLESVIENQHDDLRDEVVPFVHGPKGTSTWGRCVGRIPKAAPKLTREQWLILGRRIKVIRSEISQLGLDLQQTKGGTKAVCNQFFKAAELGLARCWLDSIVCAQHPDWPEAIRVFYGGLGQAS